jgi:hypothetical protein
MEPLQIREMEIFETLKSLSTFKFVVIGGYAVNAYTLPRFSVDCDIVIENGSELNEIEKTLLKIGYDKKDVEKSTAQTNFVRHEKVIDRHFGVSIDVLIGEVLDRQTGVSIPAEWIFKNSEMKALKGKTITDKLEVRIINVDALFVMKMISCRQTDIRDIFMMSPIIKNKGWIKTEISSRYDFNNRFKRVKSIINSKEFRNGLQGVYGLIDNKTFERNISSIESLGSQSEGMGTLPKLGPFKREK